MTRMRALAAGPVAAAMLLLASCTGLPTTGPVSAGLALGEKNDAPPFTEFAARPAEGAGPQDIVEGFLDAGITPLDNWGIAREYLTPKMSDEWSPAVGVTIDTSSESRSITAVGDVDDKDATSADVSVQLSQVANVDATGAYAPDTGSTAPLTFHLTRKKGGEWRISQAPDGIVLDAANFPLVFRSYSLQYFDPSWTHLVPDARWYPRGRSTATTLTQQVVSGAPAPWLAPGVRNAFTDEVSLARGAVVIDQSQVAEVDLTRSALDLDATTLARMRTQLEATLAPLGVAEVRFTVDQRPLDASTVQVEQPAPDAGTLVLTKDGFGTAVGDQIVPVGDLSAQVNKNAARLRAIDVAADESAGAMMLDDGHVYLATSDNTAELDARAGLIAPSLDTWEYTWTVPRGTPGALLAIGADAVPHKIERAWPGASEISALRVSADGARVTALVTVGSQRRIVVAAVIRNDKGVPTGLGEMHELGRFPSTALGLSWVGSDAVAILTSAEEPHVLTQPIGGPADSTSAPAGPRSISGARAVSGVRILATDGVVFAQRGSTWQASIDGVLVLGTRSGQ
ncbi:LpqB family beta-propeller domain-containing protein [Microbacterium sp. NPDC057659]|uniref:LpqB family beta-propeller domain-containing protein n=1 Tax=Microbacterium sp. NPDC057659 TaxID=3346198 RepID=UPI00366BC05A